MEDSEKRFGIKFERIRGGWSLGVAITLNKWFGEHYLYINLVKWSISIGWMNFSEEEFYVED